MQLAGGETPPLRKTHGEKIPRHERIAPRRAGDLRAVVEGTGRPFPSRVRRARGRPGATVFLGADPPIARPASRALGARRDPPLYPFVPVELLDRYGFLSLGLLHDEIQPQGERRG